MLKFEGFFYKPQGMVWLLIVDVRLNTCKNFDNEIWDQFRNSCVILCHCLELINFQV